VASVNGRRVTCLCRCHTVRIISIDQLEAGTAASSCGCMPLTATENKMLRAEAERRRTQQDWK
jgi:hypothetical protein